jgi:hypothetical protein
MEAYVTPKCRLLQDPHSVTSQKTHFFTDTAMKTPIYQTAPNSPLCIQFINLLHKSENIQNFQPRHTPPAIDGDVGRLYIQNSPSAGRTNELCGAEHHSRGHKLGSHSVDSQNFMEPESSLPSSQQPSTCTYPEPDQSSPQRSILSLKGQS